MTVLLLVLGFRHLAPYLRRFAPRVFAPVPLWRMLRLGLPIGTQMLLEWGAFGAIALLMGWLGVIQMAALIKLHSI